MNEDDKDNEFKKVKEGFYHFFHWNKEIQKSMDKLEQARQFITQYTNKNIKTGKTMLSIFRGFESENYYPEELISGISSRVSSAVSDLECVKYDLDNSVDKIYGVTGTMATSDINMATGIDEVRLFFNNHQQTPQISRVYEVHKDQLSPEDKIQKLVRGLEPFNDDLTNKLNEIRLKLNNLNSKANLTSMGHLLSDFIDKFLKTLAQDDLLNDITWIKRKSPYYRCIFVIIGYDLTYRTSHINYIEIEQIAQNYTNIIQRCDIIKHNPYNWDLTKLRLKVLESFNDMINYTITILDLHSLHFVENEKGSKFNNKSV